MPLSLAAVKSHAAECAVLECISTPELLARALNCSPEAARAGLKFGAETGFFRPVPLPNLSNRLGYQPTLKALKLSISPLQSCPKFQRCGLPPDSRLRGFLRGYVRFSARPELSFFGALEQDLTVCTPNAVPTLGYSRALIGMDSAQHLHIFVPVLRAEHPSTAIELAALRWLPLLNTGRATLHFVAHGGTAAALTDALAGFTSTPAAHPAIAELVALDAQIAADRSGLLTIKSASKRRELTAAIAAAGPAQAAAGAGYSWLAAAVELAA
jgi:hypothetical protein